MNTDAPDYISLVDEDAGFDTMQDIENKTSDTLRQRRAYKRAPFKSKVTLQPGNSSEFLSYKVQGITGDISVAGCRAMFPVPIQVGDVYRMHFDREKLDLPMTFARCVRCRIVAEDAYETGLTFFRPINLPEQFLDKK
ncbi:MAG: PilZ domain-containing protein [Planctomycetes bacterium]|nr:PilZ domain-containing protein [Planctomycetota bacterium]